MFFPIIDSHLLTLSVMPFVIACRSTSIPLEKSGGNLGDTLFIEVPEGTTKGDVLDRINARLGQYKLPNGLTQDGAYRPHMQFAIEVERQMRLMQRLPLGASEMNYTYHNVMGSSNYWIVFRIVRIDDIDTIDLESDPRVQISDHSCNFEGAASAVVSLVKSLVMLPFAWLIASPSHELFGTPNPVNMHDFK